MNAVASEAEGADTVKLLLDRGADPNARMTEGETSLDWAIYKGDRAKIAVLEQYGAQRGDGPRREEIPPPAKGGIADPRLSLTRSVARLLEVAPKFREQATCISCHHNAMPALAAANARRKGIEIDTVRARKNLDDILTFFKSNAPRMMLGDPAVGGEALTTGYAQMALAADGHPLDRVTATMTHWLLARQMPDGRWLGNGLNRPPSEYSVISHTAIATGGLRAYPLPGRKHEIAESLQRARQWLLAAEPKSAEERGMRLMGLVWTDAPRPRRGCRDQGDSRSTGSRRRLVSVRPHRPGRLRHRPVPLCPARRRRVADRRGLPQRHRVPARQSVSGRSLAREDALLSGPAVLRKRISFRAASMDLRRRNELGVTGDRADVARRVAHETADDRWHGAQIRVVARARLHGVRTTSRDSLHFESSGPYRVTVPRVSTTSEGARRRAASASAPKRAANLGDLLRCNATYVG